MKILIIAALPALIALLLWAVLDLESFVLVGVLGAIIFPASLIKPGGANVDAADLLLLLALASWLVNNSLRRAPDPWVKGNLLILPATLFLVVNLVSVAWSVRPRTTLVFGVQLTELIIIFPVVLATIPTSLAKIRKGIFLLIGFTCIESLSSLVVFATHHAAKTAGNNYLPGFNKNGLGSFLAAGLVIAYAMWLQAGRSGARKWLMLGIVIDMAGTVASGSRGAILGAGVGILMVAFVLRRQGVTGRVLALVLAVSFGGLYVTYVAPNRAQNLTQSGSYDSSLIRHLAWRDAVKTIEQNPWLGSGARTYEDDLGSYGITPDPLNLFLLTWAELGIPGMLALGFLLFRFGVLFRRARNLPPEAAAIAVGAGGVAISFFVHSQVDISWVRGETTLEFAMIGVMLAVTRLASPAEVGERPGGSRWSPPTDPFPSELNPVASSVAAEAGFEAAGAEVLALRSADSAAPGP